MIDHKDKLELAKTHNVQNDMICESIGFAKGPKFEEIEKNRYCICYVCEKHFSGKTIKILHCNTTFPFLVKFTQNYWHQL